MTNPEPWPLQVAQMLSGEEGTVIGLGIKPRCAGGVAREVRLTRRRLASSVGVPGGGQDVNGERVRRPSGGGEPTEEKTGLERVLEYHRGHSQEYVNRWPSQPHQHNSRGAVTRLLSGGGYAAAPAPGQGMQVPSSAAVCHCRP